MVARLLPPADGAVYPGRGEPADGDRIQEQVVDSQASVATTRPAGVFPERVDRLGRVQVAELIAEIPQGRLTNTWTTAPYFSRLHLNLSEDAVAAVCRMLLEPRTRS
ncbi:MAG: hypothetical protein JWO38_4377 [Gemmataceae bacterium]|nr:hypothetical protein [Gemmataceae bacterium]